MKPYIGEDGKLVKFDADTSSSAGSESYKMWVDKSTIPDGYQLQYSTGEGVEFTDRRVAGGGYQLGPNRLVNYRVLLMEKQDEAKMHKEATPTTPQISKAGQGAVWGKVSWDYESAGGVQWGMVSTPTSPADGITVTASYLSDYALKQIYSDETANMLGLSKPSDIRGSGWTFRLETQLQEWIAEQVAKDKAKWIAETVSAKTNAEGNYLIQFKGTWGPHRNTSAVADYTRVAGKYYAGDAHRWTEEEVRRLGTVAEHADEGSFLTGALDWNEKHVNSDWLFISIKDTDDVVKRTPWNYNWYTGSNNAWGIHGGWAQAAFGVSTVQPANSTRADFNLAPAEIKFNITNFDTQKNTAIPGDVAVTNTAGLPYKYTNDSFKIVWYDQDGNKIKEEPTQKPTSTGALAEATYDTKDVKETKTFIAKLHYVDSKGNLGQVLAQDAFTVKISKLVVSAYDEVSIENPAANDDSMKGAAYSAEGLPEGLTIDEKTGTVSGKAKVPGKYTVTVTTSILDEDSGETMEATSNYTALVTDSPLEQGEVDVEYKETVKPAEVEGYVFKNVSAKFIDGKAIEGLTITGDQISGTPKAEVAATQEDPNVEVTYDIYKLNSKGEEVLIKEGHKDLVPLEITKAASQAPKYEPAYADTDATPGTEVTTDAPKFLDQKSTEATKPEAKPQPTSVKFALGDGAPQGATIDETTGKVTYTPTARDANTTVDIPVKVTYSDGTIDETLAKIKVGQAQADSYQPEYTEADAKAGAQTTITAPNFKNKDGQPAAKPDGAKFTLAKDAPTDATINEDTGEITYTPSIDQAGKTVNIPVTVTYKDGSTDEVKAPIKVAQGDNLNYEPEYKSVVAQVGHPVTVEAPKFLDKENKEASPQPTGMTFAIEEGFTVNGAIEIEPKTGAITYTAVDADKDTVIKVPVIVTYADGSKESVKAKIDVPSDANFYDPKAKPLTTEQGTVPPAKDGVDFEHTPPADTKYEWEALPPVNKAGNTIGTVKITYPDGTTDTVEVPVTVTASESKVTKVDDTNKKTVDPTDQKQGTGIVVTNPDDTTKVSATDANGESVPAVINKETGQIEVTPGTDAKGPITVTVTDNDFPTGETFKVPVKEKSATPVITEPKAGDQTILGTGIAGSQITLAIYGGEGSEDTQVANNIVVGQDGTWTANVPAGVNLNEYDIILATQTEQGKSVSDEARVAVQALTDAEKNDPEAVANPIETEVGKVPEAKNGIANIGELDNVEGVVWLTNPDVSKVADNVKGTAVVVYKDGSTDKVEVPIKVVDKTAPVIDKIGNQTVVEGKPIADVIVKTDDPKATITISGQPDGVTIDGNKISGTPTVSDWGKDEEERDFTVTVTAEDEAGNKGTTEFTIKVQRDTDGDGTPDIYDNDDDGDGIPDDKDNNPKVADKTTVDETGKKPVKPNGEEQGTGVKVENSGDDTTVTATDKNGKDVPATIDPETGEIKVTPGKDTEGPITVVVTDKDLSDGKTEVEIAVEKPEEKDTTAPKIDRISDQTVVEKQPIKEIEVKTDDPEAEITVDGLPNGVTYDKDSKKITGSPELTDWNDDKEKPEEVRVVTVTVKAKDKAGNESEEIFTITVQRDTDGDGTPDIYDNDDDGDGIPDDKDNNPKVADKTTVDGTPKTVMPNGEAQDSGLTVKNKEDKTPTTVEAKDEDGNTVPVEIGKDGKIIVTPSEDVDGPISLTVQDDDFITDENPEGKITYEIPVDGHEKDKDDNDSDKEPEAKEYQVVFNANGGTPTTQTAKVREGEKVEGVTEPTREGYNFVKWVVLGTDKIFDPNTNFNKDMLAEGEDSLMVVAVWEKLEDKKIADEVDPTIPEKTEVEDTNKLTEDEKKEVKDKIEEANKDKFPEDTEVEVDDKGNATITYPDESTDTIPAEDLVKEKESEDKKIADEVDPTIPEKTEVEDTNKLTEDEKKEVKDKIEEANKDKFPEGTEVEVDDKGDATITYPDGSKDTIPAEDLVFQYKHGEPEIDDKPELPIADIIEPNTPDKTEVEDKDNLTEKEKEEVKDKIEEANKGKFPEGTEVEVGDNGDVTVTYPDGSKDVIPGDQTVTEKEKSDAEKNPAVTPDEKTGVKDLNNLTDKEKVEVKDKVQKANPKAKDVTIDDKGNATITYPDGSTNTIPAEELVFQYEHGEPEETEKPELPIADIIDPIIPEKTEVGRPGLTQREREEVERKIIDANKGNFPEGTQVIVDESGNATIIYPDGSIDTIPWNKLVFHRDEEGGAVETDKPSDEASDKDAKGTEEASSTAKSSAGLLPETGESASTAIFGAAALSVLAGLGLVAKRREDEEA